MKQNFEVIIIGGGPSGMMAAIAAAENGAQVLLLEKNKRLGRKLLLTGGGRCNVTNDREVADLINHIPGNGKFLYSTFAQWNNQDIIDFFISNGVALKEEDHGRMFPVTDKAQTIVTALQQKMQELGVVVITQAPVQKLIQDGTQIQGVRTETAEYSAPCVILTTGGKTYPSTGSTGDGYQLAKKVGHHVTPLFPTESPLISEAPVIQQKLLQGVALRDISLTVLNQKNRPIVTHTMDVLFTHFGLSGPAALRCSYFVNQELKKRSTVEVSLDCFHQMTVKELIEKMALLTQDSPKSIKNALQQLLPERLLAYFIDQNGLTDKVAARVSPVELTQLAAMMKDFRLPISRTFGLEKSFVTGGGIQLKEVNPKTLESKLLPGLFFAGEILDVNGYTGGYNITAAFCTGHVAGDHAAQLALYGWAG